MERIGEYDLTSSLKLGVYDGGLVGSSSIHVKKSTSDNIEEIVKIYQNTLFQAVTLGKSPSVVQIPRIESVTTARLQILLKEFDLVFSILQQRIRELAYHHHVVDKAIDNWQHQTFKRFDGLGNNPDVPLWLRSQKGTVFFLYLCVWFFFFCVVLKFLLSLLPYNTQVRCLIEK